MIKLFIGLALLVNSISFCLASPHPLYIFPTSEKTNTEPQERHAHTELNNSKNQNFKEPHLINNAAEPAQKNFNSSIMAITARHDQPKLSSDFLLGIALTIIPLIYFILASPTKRTKIKLITLRWLDIFIYAFITTIIVRVATQSSTEGIYKVETIRRIYESNIGLYCALIASTLAATYSATYQLKIWHPNHKLKNLLKHPSLLTSVGLTVTLLTAVSEIQFIEKIIISIVAVTIAIPSLFFEITNKLHTRKTNPILHKQTSPPSSELRCINAAEIFDWLKTDNPKILKKTFFDGDKTVNAIAQNFIIEGKFNPTSIALIGEFGSGKTTTCHRMISHLKKQLPHSGIIEVFISSWERDTASLKSQILSEVINSLSAYADTFALAGLPDAYSKAIKSFDKISEIFAEFVSRSPHDPKKILAKIDYFLRKLDLNVILVVEDIDRDPSTTDHDINLIAAFLDALSSVNNIGFLITLREDALTKQLESDKIFDPHGLLRRVFSRKEYMPTPEFRPVISSFNQAIISEIMQRSPTEIRPLTSNELSSNWEGAFESIRHFKQTLQFFYELCQAKMLDHINYNDLFILSATKYSMQDSLRCNLPKDDAYNADPELRAEKDSEPLLSEASHTVSFREISRAPTFMRVADVDSEFLLPSQNKFSLLKEIYLESFKRKYGYLEEPPQHTLDSLRPFFEGNEALNLSTADANFEVKLVFIRNILFDERFQLKTDSQKLVAFIDRLTEILDFKNVTHSKLLLDNISKPIAVNWNVIQNHNFHFYQIATANFDEFLQLLSTIAGYTSRSKLKHVIEKSFNNTENETAALPVIFNRLVSSARLNFHDEEFERWLTSIGGAIPEQN